MIRPCMPVTLEADLTELRTVTLGGVTAATRQSLLLSGGLSTKHTPGESVRGHSGRRCAGDYVKTKRALIRAVEKQAEMEERMDLLKARRLLCDSITLS